MPIKNYDVIVVGAGHAGCEAALAAARLGKSTLLLTINLDYIALMPCNPAVGGPGKSHLVREIDALGGQMGLNTDLTYIQKRVLNTGKGPAVRALRAQVDKKAYQDLMMKTVMCQPGLDVKQGLVEEILYQDGAVIGVRTNSGVSYGAKALVICTGTYLGSKVIIGPKKIPVGPNNQINAVGLIGSLYDLGFKMIRLQTTTPPRIDRRTVDFSQIKGQPGDANPEYFSFLQKDGLEKREQLSCWLTYTNIQTHGIIRQNLDLAGAFVSELGNRGPRYCPSIEEKINRFPERTAHQIFLEPEGSHTFEMYVQGFYNSLPERLQVKALRTIKGLEQVEIMRPGYGIEYDCLVPAQLTPGLGCKGVKGLYSAGQVNGSSGYEEAAAQGLIAGINAARYVEGQDEFILKRSEAYIGVLIDDLVTKEINEPYRVLTSRAEYRLLLRQDNADLRLTEKGYRLGLVSEERYRIFVKRQEGIISEKERLENTFLKPQDQELKKFLAERGSSSPQHGISLVGLLRRPDVHYRELAKIWPPPEVIPEDVAEQVEIQIKYEGYLRKQEQQVERFARLENRRISPDLDYQKVTGLSSEAREKLTQVKPVSIGQASRIAGVSPADISVLLVNLERFRRDNHE